MSPRAVIYTTAPVWMNWKILLPWDVTHVEWGRSNGPLSGENRKATTSFRDMFTLQGQITISLSTDSPLLLIKRIENPTYWSRGPTGRARLNFSGSTTYLEYCKTWVESCNRLHVTSRMTWVSIASLQDTRHWEDWQRQGAAPRVFGSQHFQ